MGSDENELAPLTWSGVPVPRLVAREGESARRRFLEFFAATIRNRNTRMAYFLAIRQFFEFCDRHGFRSLDEIEPMVVASYIERHPGSVPTIKQHLAAIRRLFDWLVIGQVLPHNPAHAVRGPRHIVHRGKTPVLDPDQARQLFDSIDTATLIGLRDRALIGVMVFSFARISATLAMNVADYHAEGKRWWLRLQEKGGKQHSVPAHHLVEEYLDAYLNVASIENQGDSPLFRSIDRTGRLTPRRLHRSDALAMVKRRALAIGLPQEVCCHSFRATGITQFLNRDGRLEIAQKIAGHESPRTTKLYDRTSDKITVDEIEKIQF